MAKKRKKSPAPATPQAKKKKPFNWRKAFYRGFLASVFAAIIAVPVGVYSHMQSVAHDLSVIGNGTPTVVQIHDPGCQLCRRLRDNLDSVKGEFTDNIQFKIADLSTDEGHFFAGEHEVSNVTLLFFNKRGVRVNTLHGVIPEEQIQDALETLEKSR